MGRFRFVAGALGIIAGFFVYQYGFLLILNLSQSLSDWSMTLFPWLGLLEVRVMGAVLQLVGGVIAIVGLLVCISWVGSQPRGKLLPSGLPGTSEPEARIVVPLQKCRFCGADIEPDAAFCPKCQRAQV